MSSGCRTATRICYPRTNSDALGWSRSSTVAAGILEGSPGFESEFADRFFPRIKAFFRMRVTSPELVEELTQETIVAALLALRAGKLREHDALEAFVLGIARRQHAEAIRSRAKEQASVVGDEIEETLGPPALSPEWTLTIRGELDALERVDQRILWLILVEGFRPAEVARELGLTEEAIRQRKSRLLRRLAEKINTAAVTNPAPPTTLPRKSIPGTQS